MYSFTVTSQDKHTRETLSGVTVEVKYNIEGSGDYTATPVREGYYEFEEGHVYYIHVKCTKDGYALGRSNFSVGFNALPGQEYSITVSMIKSGMQWACTLYYFKGATRKIGNYDYVEQLYEKQNDEWVLVESYNRIATPTFWYEADSGKEYKIVLKDVAGLYKEIEIYSESGYPSETEYYTKLKEDSVIEVDVKDAHTEESINDATVTVQVVRSSILQFNSYANAYIKDGDTTMKQVRITVEKEGYSTAIDTFSVDTVGTDFIRTISMDMIPVFTIAVEDEETGESISDFTAHVYLDDELIETSTDGKFYHAWDGTSSYDVTVDAYGYETALITGAEYPDERTVEMERKFVELAVLVTDSSTGAEIEDPEIVVHDVEFDVDIDLFTDAYPVQYTHIYDITASAEDYPARTERVSVESLEDIEKTIALVKEMKYVALTVNVTDKEDGHVITDADIAVTDAEGAVITPVDGVYNLIYNDDRSYTLTVTKSGYTSHEEEIVPESSIPLRKEIELKPTSEIFPFATTTDLKNRTGISYTAAELERIEYLLDDISNVIRSEGRKCDVDVDAEVAKDKVYASIVRTVTCDVTQRVLRQSMEGDAMTQESQSALGYSWSGTYAIPGGGIAMSLMRNEKDILGFNPQTIGVIELC